MATDGSSQLQPDRPGHLRRATAWSKASAARAGAWAQDARGDHASIDIGFRTFERENRVAAMVLAGGIAYRLFFWMLALWLVVGGVLGFFNPDAVQDAAKDQGLGMWAAAALAAAAHSSAGNEWWLLLTGFWLVLWTGYTCTKALVLAHAVIWELPPRKVTRPLHASLVFNGFTLGFIAAMAAARWLRGQDSVAGLAATLLVFVVPFGLWLIAARSLPNRARTWVDLVPGAAVLALGLQAMYLFTTYFLGPKLASATQLYGVLGVATTILFWFYLAGRLIISAATLNTSLVQRREQAEGPAALAADGVPEAPRRRSA